MTEPQSAERTIAWLLQRLHTAAEVEPTPLATAPVITAFPQGSGTYWLRLLADVAPAPISGKYLFFAANPSVLSMLALAELSGHGFREAKLSVSPSATGEHCLCLFDGDDTRAGELADRHPYVRFAGVKTTTATLAGHYEPGYQRTREARAAGTLPPPLRWPRPADGWTQLDTLARERYARAHGTELTDTEHPRPDALAERADGEAVAFYRCHGQLLCAGCGRAYSDHPQDHELDELTVLCDSRRVKL